MDIKISSGFKNMDIRAIHHFLTNDSYWAKGISYDLVEKSLSNSYCVGAFINEKQVAFGRVITDYYTFGWFADFYVLPEFRGVGISKLMLTHIAEQPWCKR